MLIDMIGKSNRFHGRNSLQNVYKTGRSIPGGFVSLRFLANKRKDYRLAVVVSRKVSKSAVVRNRIRRRIYEIVRLYRREMSQPWPFDLVITVFDEKVAAMEAEELSAHLQGLLQKAGR